MKKILGILLIITMVLFINQAFATYSPDKIQDMSFNANINNQDIGFNYKYFKKGNKLKVVNELSVNYIDMDTKSIVTYLPASKMAFKQNLNLDDGIYDVIENQTKEKIEHYKDAYAKIDTPKTINGYSCTMYRQASSHNEVCIYEPYQMMIYGKFGDTTVTLSDISLEEIPDKEFQIPANIKVQEFDVKSLPIDNFY